MHPTAVKLKKLFKYISEQRCKQVAEKISDKTTNNLLIATDYVSDLQDMPIAYEVKRSDGYDVKVIGSQIMFIEFGTGIYNPFYPLDYKNPNNLPIGRGTYGLNKGNRRAWGFYPQHSGNVASKNGDYEIIKKNGKSVIITHGLYQGEPIRPIYQAIKDTKKEVSKR